jgi:30S ribosomal protein S31
MGKGDRRTKRGKIFRGTYGNTRLKKKRKKAPPPSPEGKTPRAES